MAEPTIQLGGGNWAGKTDNLLGYYKEGERFYKQDFTFSRSTTGTYTDSEGYIQEMPYNLLTYSEDFSQWSLNTSGILSIEANYAASPEGLQNAYKVNFIVQSDSDLSLSQTHTITGGSTYVYSIYIKGEGTNIGKDVVIKSKRQGGGDSAGTTTTQTLTNEWKRINFTTTYAANNINGRLLISSNEATSCLIYGAQAEEGSSAKTYFPTTTRLNIPRVDYLNNSNGSLILEPQRTNLLPYSSDFSNSSYIRNQTTATTGFISPDGNLNAYKLLEDNTNNIHRIYQTSLVTASPNATISVYVKYNGRRFVLLRIADSTVGRWYDVENGVLGSIFQGTPNDSTIESVGDNWYRITISHSVTSQARFELWVSDTESTSAYQGDTTKGVYIWGAQVEVGSYPTTLINTSGSSVTRNADTCTDGGDASRFNDSEGVIFAEISALADENSNRYFSINDGSANNRIRFGYTTPSNSVRLLVVASSIQVDITEQLSNTSVFNKIAIKYKQNDFALWVNGVEIATDTSGNTPSGLSQLDFDNAAGGDIFYGNVKQIQVYNTALTDSELATLTTL